MHNNHISHTNKWFATQLIYAEANRSDIYLRQ